MRTLIIAEAGVNHNGDINLAKKLIEEAAFAGADFIKFQSFRAKNIISEGAPKAEYQKKNTAIDESQLEMIMGLELSKSDHQVLIDECNRIGIKFFSTAFDVESFDMLMSLDCLEMIKIPSGELTNLPFLRHAAKHGKPLLLSTGMASMGEIKDALEVIESAGTGRDLVTILQCTTEYPAPMCDVNLRAMESMGKTFGTKFGYSDHTESIEIALAAVALGACVIEKHFTLDRRLPGPDHIASLEPKELREMISKIRNIEISLGDGIKKPSQQELSNSLIVRKSIVARSEIHAGDIFSIENLTTKRPGNGISPMEWDIVLGQMAKRDFAPDELIEI